MDISRLADLLKNKASSAAEDYSQLANAYPNLKNFAGALVGNIERNVPTQAELENPEAMQQRAIGYLSPMANAIKVSHGSPHLFDRFDMSKIGTGEGAQVYGHGLYFAQDFNSPVAKKYAENVQIKEQFPKEELKKLVQLKRKQNLGENLTEKEQQTFDRITNDKKAFEEAINNQNNLYNVSLEWPDAAREALDPMSPHHFLDWDKPLSEQSEFIKKKLIDVPHKGAGWDFGTTIESLEAAPYLKNAKDYPGLNIGGDEIYNSFANSMLVGNNAKGQIEATEKLKELGIPGIRYLDQGSRDLGEGTSNYVVFDDKIPRIVEILKGGK